MTRGIYLGTLLTCFSLALNIGCSWASHEGSWINNPTASLWRSQGRKGSRPQDGFRQANEVKDSSSKSGAKHEPFPSDKYYLSSQTNPRWQSFHGSSGYVSPKKVGQSGGSVGNSNQNNVFRTWPGQQGSQRIGQYAPSKPGVSSPKVSSQQLSAWKPYNRKVQQKPGLGTKLNGNQRGFKPPKEFMKPTSGLSRGSKKVYHKGVSKYSSSGSPNKPIVSSIGYRYERPISHNLGLTRSYQAPVNNQAYNGGDSSTVVHNIPWEYGGHPIKRSGDEEPVKQVPTTERPKKSLTLQPLKTSWTRQPLKTSWTRQPLKIYTIPPHTTEPYRTRPPKPHKKSKWIQVLSYKLAESHGVPVRTL